MVPAGRMLIELRCLPGDCQVAMMRRVTFEVFQLSVRDLLGAFRRRYGGPIREHVKVSASSIRRRAGLEVKPRVLGKNVGKAGMKGPYSRSADAAEFLLGPVGAEMLLNYSTYPDSRDLLRDLCRSVVEEDDCHLDRWKKEWSALRRLLLDTKARQAKVSRWESYHTQLRVERMAAPRL